MTAAAGANRELASGLVLNLAAEKMPAVDRARTDVYDDR